MKLPRVGKVASGLPSVAGSVGTGSVLAGVLGTIYGGPGVGLTSAAIDFAGAYPLTKLVRSLRPPRQSTTNFVRDASGQIVPALEPSRLENAANVAGSLGASWLGANLMAPQVEPTQMSQDETIMHQMMQRQAVNNLQIPQAVAPGTQFQTTGIEFLQNYIQPQVSNMKLPLPARVQQLLEQTGMELGI